MPTSTPSSVTRYRPAILVLTGAAAAYAAYIVYSALQNPPSDGLHRSNAVRRRLRRRRSASARPLSLTLASHPQGPALGEYDLFGTSVPLNTHNLVPASELREIITSVNPDASAENVERAIADVYDSFLDRLFATLFHGSVPSPLETEAIRRWIGDRIPDDAAVVRAAQRHVYTVSTTDVLVLSGAESVAHTELSWGSDEDTEDDTLDPDGQTLQRTLYHIAEDRAKQEGVVHRGITCNGCDEKPIRGVRWHCANCVDFDLCSNCEATNSHCKTHIFYKIRVPAPCLGLSKQEPLYSGKPHMMSPSIDPTLKKRLVSETKMEAEEVEALWDQFTCLAGTEWAHDPTGVGWALDRRAFNHAFVPRYNSFVAAPSLIYDRVFAYYDTDKNGYIGFEEWIKGLDGMHTTDVDVKARIVFNGYDIDGDGYVSRKDVLRIFRAFYAVEQEATRNYVAERNEELSVRNALATIRSSQPLGSAFPPPNSMGGSNSGNPRLRHKQADGDDEPAPVIENDNIDIATRDDILRMNTVRSSSFGESTREAQNRIVVDRWSRRQFYVDEEEGLSQPVGAEEASPEYDRPKLSRSSSRVRFEDDVEVETRSNASTSSRPVGERWGGYEVPELEKDLGREVLYQITQQGYNELLDPLFLEKEDMAMDASETRAQRRKDASLIDQAIELFHIEKKDLEVISQIGIFRYSKCVVHEYCKLFNNDKTSLRVRRHLQLGDGTFVSRFEAISRCHDIYRGVEGTIINSAKTSQCPETDEITLWNIWLCRQRLEEEMLYTFMECVTHKGWVSRPDLDELPTDNSSSGDVTSVYRDPTMPQFRPNSLPNASMTANMECMVHESSESEFEDEEIGADYARSYPGGTFFVCMAPKAETPDAKEVSVAEGKIDVLPVTTDGTIPNSERQIEPETTCQHMDSDAMINWRSFTDNPDIHFLSWDSSSGVEMLCSLSRPITHATSPFELEMNPLKLLQRHIRRSAMNPDSPLHIMMLASLQIVEQEISERKGSGLISFNEFAEHMREGKYRFLGSWMEWVSI